MKNITATIKGVITGLLMIVLSLVFFYILKLPENGKNQIFVLLIMVAAVIWSLISLKLKATDQLTFKDYFSEGFKTFIVVTLFMAIYTFVFYKLNPQILEDAIIKNNKLVQVEGNHTDVEIAANADKLRNIFMPMMLAVKTIEYLILGALVSLIGAGFLGQKK
jgi:hypothetical protein